MSTIFITITRGALARNILRTKVFKNLVNDNHKIIIIIPTKAHQYFLDEFKHGNVYIEEVKNSTLPKIRKFFLILFNGLVYTETEHRKIKFGGAYKKPNTKTVYWIKHILFSIISKFKIFKKIARWIEFNIIIEKEYDYLFQKHKPNLLFCSSIYSQLDAVMIKAAKRLKVKSISMPKSWDTVGRLFFRAPSDVTILNNEFMKDWVASEQLIKENNIKISGFPQFDIYKNKKKYLSKEEFCKKTDLDNKKPIILYASEGLWTHWDEVYIDDLINNHGINEKYNLILRPHYSNMRKRLYHRFKKFPNIYIDDENIKITNMFSDYWDPTEDNMDWTAEVLNISDTVVTFMSTFVLDSFAFNKPVVNIYYDLLKASESLNSGPIIPMRELYNCTHYNVVLNEKSVSLANNGEEVISLIEQYLKNNKLHQKERQNTINKLCYKIDGNSSERIYKIIKSNL
ncbi:CDP-glycerol glycerophosphotransferase family protein [Candidatus Parcubacteria bacterium]|nr:CDP-glycerol glycerophosphotransferase family protein [Candidatus Parcubacteria bacterium]